MGIAYVTKETISLERIRELLQASELLASSEIYAIVRVSDNLDDIARQLRILLERRERMAMIEALDAAKSASLMCRISARQQAMK